MALEQPGLQWSRYLAWRRHLAQLLVYDGKAFRAEETGTPHDLRWAAWRPDGALALLAGNSGTLVERRGGAYHAINTARSENLRGVDWRPDGAEALAVGNSGVILRIAHDSVERVPFPTPVALRRVAYHPSGEYALVAGNDGLLVRVDSNGARAAGFGAGHLRTVAWHPGGREALVCANHALYRYDPFTDALALVSELGGDAIDASWRPDGSEALVAGFLQGDGIWQRAGALWRWDSKRLEQLALGRTLPPLTGVAWRPQGDSALVVSNAGGTPVESGIYAYRDGALTRLLADESTRFLRAFWSPDGLRALVLGSPRARFWMA